jgi:hypothetical protein
MEPESSADAEVKKDKKKSKKSKKEKVTADEDMAASKGLKAVVLGGTGEIGRVRTLAPNIVSLPHGFFRYNI